MKQLLATFAVTTIALLACKKEKNSVPALTTTAATNVTASAITTGGSISNDGNSGITKKGIAWAIHSSPSVGDSLTNEGSGGSSFTSIVSNLNANTTYYIRAYAINATGTGYGNEISVTTAKGLATLTTTAISNLQPLSAVSGGNVTNDGGASVTERGVVYDVSPNPTISNNKIMAGTGTGTGSFTATLTPLASQKTYYVRAYATNSYGTSYGNQVQFNAASANTVTDVDGNVYPYVTIGTQNWMATNLKVTKYRNGDAITDGSGNSFDWSAFTTGAYTYPNNDITKKDSFGVIYNIYAIRDSRNVCPTGWHIPSDDEWKTLEVYEGMLQTDADATSYRGTIGGKLLQGGSSGLELQKAGYINAGTNAVNKFGIWGLYYTSTQATTDFNYYRGFNFKTPDSGPVYRNYSNYVMSVRCVKD